MPSSQPSPVTAISKESTLKSLPSASSLAVEHFGDVEGLMLVESQKVDLAKFYAESHGLDMNDPDVTATAMLKAWTRFREFSLIQAAEKKIYKEMVSSGEDYGDVLYRVVSSDSQKRISFEIRRLHDQARALERDLVSLAKLRKG
jgi:hypothetical protein